MGDDDDRNGGDGECVIPTLWKVYVWHDAREVVQACCPSRRMMCLYTVLISITTYFCQCLWSGGSRITY